MRFLRQICITLLCVVLLGGCADKKPAQPTSPLPENAAGFDTTANITYKNLSATATIRQDTPQACTVTFSSPESLQNLAFTFRTDAVDMLYKGMQFSFDPSSFPGGAAANMAVAAINAAVRDDGLKITAEEGALELTGVMESGEFHMRLDAQNGNLIKLSVPAEDFEIEFDNFRFLE